jgi:NOL1/NOP2/sun family putative RNA methylase
MAIKLPENFETRMKALLGDEFDAFLASYDKKDKSGIRINTLKISPDAFEKLSNFSLKKIPWINTGFYYGEDDIPSKHPYYYAGLYYIQEPSAMTPATLFDIKPGDKVLDMCAAPGGKSTALAAKLGGTGLLVSNDVSNSRAKALLKNIELFGVRNALVLSESTSKLASRFYGYFDKILVDAPCSGEGMFRKQPAIMKNWEQYGTGYYADIQRSILPDAVKMLKPGGKLLFSTCTFSPDEDEETVAFLLDKFPELKLVSPYPDKMADYFDSCGFDHGRADWMKNAVPGIEKTIRLWPHRLDGEGHFLAVFEKSAEAQCDMAYPKAVKKAKLPLELEEFLKQTTIDYKNSTIIEKDNRYYIVSDELPDVSGLRILRNGLLLGEMKKNRFEPSQALACALTPSEYSNTYDLSSDNPDVLRYLKCESIEIPENVHDGYVLITCDGFSLGFAKVKGGSFKNKYLPGWRLM